MKINICFFSENSHIGKVPRNYANMRTEFSWICATQADHLPLDFASKPSCEFQYDLGIVILPKNQDKLFDFAKIRNCCKKLAIMQEGPNWYFQDYSTADQLAYLGRLNQSDFLFCHNPIDVSYYKGLIGKSIYVMPSLIIEDALEQHKYEEGRSGVMINGNMTSWYGGMDSYVVAQTFDEPIFGPSMGRRQEDEHLLNITRLPYMMWSQWMNKLNSMKYAVNLMRTYAATTFSLNCAYLGIPCLGYVHGYTQSICFPDLSCAESDLASVKLLAEKLKNDEDFYQHCSATARQQYQTVFHENIFVHDFSYILHLEELDLCN